MIALTTLIVAVAVLVPAVVDAVSEPEGSRAIDRRVLVDDVLFETRDRGDGLERRAGAVVVLDRLVAQRVVLVGDQFVPELRRDPARELGRVERGARYHGQDLAVAGVDRDHRPDLVAERGVGGQLQILVDGEHQVLAGHGGLVRQRLEHAALAALELHAAEGVDLLQLLAVVAAKHVIELLLEAVLADVVADFVAAGRDLVDDRQLRRIDLTDITEQMRSDLTIDVGALDLVAHLHAGHLDFPGLDLGHLVARQVSLDLHSHEGGLAPGLVELRVDLRFGHLDELREERDHLLGLLGLAQILGDDLEIEGRPVVDQHLAGAIEDHPAGRIHPHPLDAVLLGRLAHLVALEDLQIDQARGQEPQADEHDDIEVFEAVLKLPDLFFLA